MTGNISNKRKVYIFTMKALMYVSVGITCALVLFLIGYVLIKGIPNISWELVSTKPSYLTERIGILPDILPVAVTGQQIVALHLRENIGSVTVVAVKIEPIIIHSCVGDFNSDTFNFNGVRNFEFPDKCKISLPQMLVCKQEGAGL